MGIEELARGEGGIGEGERGEGEVGGEDLGVGVGFELANSRRSSLISGGRGQLREEGEY